MPVKRVLMILLGVAVVAGLSIWRHEFSHSRDAHAVTEWFAVEPEANALPTEASRVTEDELATQVEARVQPSTDVGEQDAAGPLSSFMYDRADRSDEHVTGAAVAECEKTVLHEACVAAFSECRHKSLSLEACKSWFEPRDPRWAPDAEQGIREFLADIHMLHLSVHPVLGPRPIPLDCRTTYCKVELDVDRAALIDYQKSVGRYDESYERGPRETRFFALTTRWADDRAKELRFALAYAGLLNDDSEVEVSGVVPAYHEEDAVLIITVHRCAKSKEHC